ncbi:MAG: hypothetical protein ABUT20_53880, partial [Bacteroidota bacterium]
GKPAKSIELFNAFIAAYRTIGPIELYPVKSSVALLTQMRFCSLNKMGSDYIDIHLVLTESHESFVFYKIDNLANRFFVHHCVSESPAKYQVTYWNICAKLTGWETGTM